MRVYDRTRKFRPACTILQRDERQECELSGKIARPSVARDFYSSAFNAYDLKGKPHRPSFPFIHGRRWDFFQDVILRNVCFFKNNIGQRIRTFLKIPILKCQYDDRVKISWIYCIFMYEWDKLFYRPKRILHKQFWWGASLLINLFNWLLIEFFIDSLIILYVICRKRVWILK